MNFMALWQRRLISILEQIAKGETDYEEVAREIHAHRAPGHSWCLI